MAEGPTSTGKRPESNQAALARQLARPVCLASHRLRDGVGGRSGRDGDPEGGQELDAVKVERNPVEARVVGVVPEWGDLIGPPDAQWHRRESPFQMRVPVCVEQTDRAP